MIVWAYMLLPKRCSPIIPWLMCYSKSEVTFPLVSHYPTNTRSIYLSLYIEPICPQSLYRNDQFRLIESDSTDCPPPCSAKERTTIFNVHLLYPPRLPGLRVHTEGGRKQLMSVRSILIRVLRNTSVLLDTSNLLVLPDTEWVSALAHPVRIAFSR